MHNRQNLLESIWSLEDILTDWPSGATWLTCAASIINVDHDDWDRTDLPDVCFYFNHVEADCVRRFQCFLQIYKYLPYPPSPLAHAVWSLREGGVVQIHGKSRIGLSSNSDDQWWLPKSVVCGPADKHLPNGCVLIRHRECHVGTFLPSLMHVCPHHGLWVTCIRLSHAMAESEFQAL
jgi:hypothetical protein